MGEAEDPPAVSSGGVDDALAADLATKLTVNGTSYKPLADGEYDAIVLGTGLTECVISGILSVAGLKVLHADRNDYYGGACASLNLEQMYSQMKPAAADGSPAAPPAALNLGRARDYLVDRVPKFILAGGEFVRVLVHTGVAKYLEFKLVDGSFVFASGRPHKVPATPKEAMTSGLMSLFEKNRCRQFFSYVHSYEPTDPSTHGGLDLTKLPMSGLYSHFGLQPDTIAFVGHALALYRDDSYLQRPAVETVTKVQLYATSLARHGRSPYLYPLYGLGELPQAFARLAAVHGGTYMLATPVDEVLTDPSGRAVGIRSGDAAATAKYVVGDPSYFPDKASVVGRTVRRYCLLSGPPPNTRDATSCQIILPASSVSPPRTHDIYVLVLSDAHKVCPSGKYLALVSTTVEGAAPSDDLEAVAAQLQPGVNLLGEVLDSFVVVDDALAPKGDGSADGVFVSRSYDASTHFESTVVDVLDMYKRMFGKELDLSATAAAASGAGGGGGGGGGSGS
ncbi:hypothetical protein BU14_1626s0001 [Porphyra umbilicalis]|uniref:Rab GDP dissociation inhibitor n=1 Tax=Porphyra umbilicalis TaxID=2786 RepID=A0A1X6NL61_PORUM|nr:hypothetical protein BU14_1626s0001 [Porphyra umbilicalis]|eukprot:OSX69312.1 hypothetical protein BU14_1626s0001 [Porphyra umbilicalis]